MQIIIIILLVLLVLSLHMRIFINLANNISMSVPHKLGHGVLNIFVNLLPRLSEGTQFNDWSPAAGIIPSGFDEYEAP